MKRFFTLFHTFGGFLFFPLLIIFGLSALNINHKFSIMQPQQVWTKSRSQIVIPDLANNQLLAEAIRDSLGLIGWCPAWTQNLNEERYKFNINHNGAERRVEAILKTGIVTVERRANGFGAILNSLHFFDGNLPDGPWIITSWKIFKDSCFFYMILALFSGLYLFMKRKSGYIPGLIFLGTALLISSILMLYIWQVG